MGANRVKGSDDGSTNVLGNSDDNRGGGNVPPQGDDSMKNSTETTTEVNFDRVRCVHCQKLISDRMTEVEEAPREYQRKRLNLNRCRPTIDERLNRRYAHHDPKTGEGWFELHQQTRYGTEPTGFDMPVHEGYGESVGTKCLSGLCSGCFSAITFRNFWTRWFKEEYLDRMLEEVVQIRNEEKNNG